MVCCSVPLLVSVVAVKLRWVTRVAPLFTVRLRKVMASVSRVCVPVPSMVTVPLRAVNTPPLRVKFPARLMP